MQPQVSNMAELHAAAFMLDIFMICASLAFLPILPKRTTLTIDNIYRCGFYRYKILFIHYYSLKISKFQPTEVTIS